MNQEDSENSAEELDGRFADMGGMLTEVKSKSTRKGDLMAFATLEDMTGQIECLVFPRVYEKYQPLLQEDTAVVISGKISVREEEAPKLLVERVARLEEWKPAAAGEPVRESGPKKTDAQLASEAKQKLFLRLERKDMDRISAVLALEAGKIPVYMHIPAEKITLLCPRDSWCNGGESCMRRLREALGESNVVLK